MAASLLNAATCDTSPWINFWWGILSNSPLIPPYKGRGGNADEKKLKAQPHLFVWWVRPIASLARGRDDLIAFAQQLYRCLWRA